jgi:hypothetical protein
VLAAGPGLARGPALLRLAWRAKRAGDHERAASLWVEAGEAGEVEGWRELAVHHEHRSRELAQALDAVGRGLALVEPLAARDRRAFHQAEGLLRRRRRLQRKAARREAETSRARS